MIATLETVFTELEGGDSVSIREDDEYSILFTIGIGGLSRVGIDLLPEEAIRIGDALSALGNAMVERIA